MAVPAPCLEVAQLVAEHHEVLYRFAYRLSGSSADAEDLTQQAFLVAHQKLDQLRDPLTARSWLFTVLRNLYLKSQRKRIATPSASLNLDIDSIPEEMPSDLHFDSELLQLALNELPAEFKTVLLFFYFEDCSYREISERLGLPIGTVMSRLSRAKGYLRSRLLEPEVEPVGSRSASAAGRQGEVS